jgi:hypothetical protein
LHPAERAASTASRISSSVAIPVDIIIGLPVAAIQRINGKSVSSNDATLYAGVFNDSNNSTALSSNGVEKSVMPTFLA